MEGPCTEYFCQEAAVFADKRLDNRLMETFNEMARRPVGTLPQKLVKRAELVGGYRLFNNRKVTPQALLEAHRAGCLQWLAEHPGKVLLLHDTTVLDYSGLTVEGLGQVGEGHGKGLYAHNSLAVMPETRQVAGLLNQILHRRAKVPAGESKKSRRDRADRESRLWKQAVAGLPAMPPGVAVTDVSDRGSDLTEYLAYEVAARRQFIVRSQHNRKLGNARGEVLVRKLHDRLRGLSAQRAQACAAQPQLLQQRRQQQRGGRVGHRPRQHRVGRGGGRQMLQPGQRTGAKHGRQQRHDHAHGQHVAGGVARAQPPGALAGVQHAHQCAARHRRQDACQGGDEGEAQAQAQQHRVGQQRAGEHAGHAVPAPQQRGDHAQRGAGPERRDAVERQRRRRARDFGRGQRTVARQPDAAARRLGAGRNEHARHGAMGRRFSYLVVRI